VIAALGAFVVTAFWMARNAGSGSDVLDQPAGASAANIPVPTAAAPKDPAPSASADPTPSVTPMVSVQGAVTGDGGSPKARTPARPTTVRPNAKSGAKPPAAEKRNPQPPAAANAGVADKLKLKTELP
jgi:hypothetical protein